MIALEPMFIQDHIESYVLVQTLSENILHILNNWLNSFKYLISELFCSSQRTYMIIISSGCSLMALLMQWLQCLDLVMLVPHRCSDPDLRLPPWTTLGSMASGQGHQPTWVSNEQNDLLSDLRRLARSATPKEITANLDTLRAAPAYAANNTISSWLEQNWLNHLIK